jgi:hypothetical protein
MPRFKKSLTLPPPTFLKKWEIDVFVTSYCYTVKKWSDEAFKKFVANNKALSARLEKFPESAEELRATIISRFSNTK